jgi:hypothetical protein
MPERGSPKKSVSIAYAFIFSVNTIVMKMNLCFYCSNNIGSIEVVILVLVALTINLVTSNERVSKRFAEQLFEYPLPEETSLISKHQFNGKNFLDGGGSGGYWNVVAIMNNEVWSWSFISRITVKKLRFNLF